MDGAWRSWTKEHWIVLAEVEAELGVVVSESGGLLVLLHLVVEQLDASQDQTLLLFDVEVGVLRGDLPPLQKGHRVQLLALPQVQPEDQLLDRLRHAHDGVEQLLGRGVTGQLGFLDEVIYDLVPSVFQHLDSGIDELLSASVLRLDETDPLHQQPQFLDEHVEAILVNQELKHYVLGAPLHAGVGIGA